MTAELIGSVVEIIDSAHHYRYELAEVADGIKSLQNQVKCAADTITKPGKSAQPANLVGEKIMVLWGSLAGKQKGDKKKRGKEGEKERKRKRGGEDPEKRRSIIHCTSL